MNRHLFKDAVHENTFRSLTSSSRSTLISLGGVRAQTHPGCLGVSISTEFHGTFYFRTSKLPSE
jgi:hypothetical protein